MVQDPGARPELPGQEIHYSLTGHNAFDAITHTLSLAENSNLDELANKISSYLHFYDAAFDKDVADATVPHFRCKGCVEPVAPCRWQPRLRTAAKVPAVWCRGRI